MTDTKLFKILEEDYWKDYCWFQHYRDSFTDTFSYLPSKDPEKLIKLTNNCFGNDTGGNAQSFNWYSPLFIYTDSVVIETTSGRPQQKVLDKMRRGYMQTCNSLNKSGFGFYFYLDDLHPNVNLYFQKSIGKNCPNAFIIVFEINNKFGGAVLLQLSRNNNVTPHNYISWELSPEILRNPVRLENNVYQRTVKYIKSSMYRFENKLFQRYLEYANEQNTKKLKEDLKIVGWFEELPKQKINCEFDLISL